MTFLLYLCKVLLCSGILLGYYWVFLRNKRFHHYNRFYLLGTLILPVVLPFFRIRIWHQPQNAVNQVVFQTLEVLTVNYGEGDAGPAGDDTTRDLFTLDLLLYIVYAAGAIALLVILIRSLLYIRRIAGRYPHEVIDRFKFYSTDEPGTPFSFFRSIFWNNQLGFNSKEGQQIFRHELFHIRQKHSIDVLLAELVTALFWCNPFVHMAKKELKAIHEFLADQYAVSGNDRYAYAELLVLHTLQARHIPVTHRFFQNHIKRRITMITHFQSNRYNYRSRLMALPIAVILFCSIALYAQQPSASTSGPNTSLNHALPAKAPIGNIINVVIDAGHGGTDKGAQSADGIAESDLTLQISKKIQQLAAAYNVNVIMTRSTDALPAAADNKDDGLRARTTIAKESKADMFVSIHLAANDAITKPGNGFEVYVTTRNEKMKPASTQLGSAILQSINSLYTTNPVLLQRNNQGIWVLDQSPCPAVLIECGYITDKKDVAFISNSSNQEALAKKILEGIVNYTNKPVAGISNTPKNTSAMRRVLSTETVKTTTRTHTGLQSYIGSTPEEQLAAKTNDSVELMTQLKRFYNRNMRYPQTAFNYNIEGTVYFSMDVSEKGEVSNFRLYDREPVSATALNVLVIVGYSKAEAIPSAVHLSTEEKLKVLQDEIKRVYERHPAGTGITNVNPGTWYFKTVFKLEKERVTSFNEAVLFPPKPRC